MNEEYVSGSLYRAAASDPSIQILSWQSVDGKGYFASDIKLRLPDQRRLEPDLILGLETWLWLIEVKGKHSEAVADETKLAELLGVLGKAEVLRQIRVRSGVDVSSFDVVPAVAYYGDDLAAESDVEATEGPETRAKCVAGILHIDWEALEAEVAESTLSSTLASLYRAQQSNT